MRRLLTTETDRRPHCSGVQSHLRVVLAVLATFVTVFAFAAPGVSALPATGVQNGVAAVNPDAIFGVSPLEPPVIAGAPAGSTVTIAVERVAAFYVYDAPSVSRVEASVPAVGEGRFPQVRTGKSGSTWVAAETTGTRMTPALLTYTPRALGPAGDAGATGLRISPQRQAGHVAGTPQHANRVKQGVPTSVWEPGANVDGLTRRAWQNGTPVPGRPNVRDFDFGLRFGTGPSGGWQSRVRVHMDQQGRIHGHPAGPENSW